jgi:hypothetical protein
MSMIKPPRDYGMAVLLLALAGLLLLLAGSEWLHFRSVRADLVQRLALKSASGDDATVNTATLADTPALESYDEMVARPLFLQSRRPPSEEDQEEAPAAPAEPKTPLNAKLMGVILTPSGKIALLVDEKGKYKRGRKNTLIDGWKLVEIKEDRVTLEQGGEQKDLPLLKPKPKATTPAAPARSGGKVSVKGPNQPNADDDGNEPDDEDSDTSEDEDTQTDETSDDEE